MSDTETDRFKLIRQYENEQFELYNNKPKMYNNDIYDDIKLEEDKLQHMFNDRFPHACAEDGVDDICIPPSLLNCIKNEINFMFNVFITLIFDKCSNENLQIIENIRTFIRYNKLYNNINNISSIVPHNPLDIIIEEIQYIGCSIFIKKYCNQYYPLIDTLTELELKDIENIFVYYYYKLK
jgi:hypothetical protein